MKNLNYKKSIFAFYLLNSFRLTAVLLLTSVIFFTTSEQSQANSHEDHDSSEMNMDDEHSEDDGMDEHSEDDGMDEHSEDDGTGMGHDENMVITDVKFSFDGIFGTFDKAQLQRGLKIYRQVCSSCHALDHMSFNSLKGLGYNSSQIAAIASEYDIEDGPDDDGEMFTRPGLISDKFPQPYKNEKAARASNFGALPPNLSTIVKARAGGADYVYSLLTGYTDPPANFTVPQNQHYNINFHGSVILMPPPFSDSIVDYEDDSTENIDTYAKDISAFLYYASHPEIVERKQLGFKVILFLIFALVIAYLLKNHYFRQLKKK